MAKNTVLNNLTEEETLWADTKRWLGMPLTFTKYRVDNNRLYCKTGFLRNGNWLPLWMGTSCFIL